MSNPDWICAIQLKQSSSSSVVTIIEAYLPSTEDQINSYLQQLEDTISANNQLGPVMVAGDFNAHIGSSSEQESSTTFQLRLMPNGQQKGIMHLHPHGK